MRKIVSRKKKAKKKERELKPVPVEDDFDDLEDDFEDFDLEDEDEIEQDSYLEGIVNRQQILGKRSSSKKAQVSSHKVTLRKNIKRVPCALPPCFGLLYLDENETLCNEPCGIKQFCRQAWEKNKDKPIDPESVQGERLVQKMKDQLIPYFWFSPKGKYISVVVTEQPDKHYFRYLRIWPNKKGIRVDITDEFQEVIRRSSYYFEILPFKEYRIRCFRPHVASVVIKDEYALRNFMKLFSEWAELRKYSPINEPA